MTNKILILIATVALGCKSADTFKPAEMPLKFSSQVYCSGFSTKREVKLVKDTKHLGAACYGYVYTGAQRVYKVFSSNGSTTLDTLIIDQNNNRDLTDDQPVKAPTKDKPVVHTLTINGATKTLRIHKASYGTFSLRVEAMDWLLGSIKLNGKMYGAALIDTNFDGVDSGGRDILLIDLNNDGKFQFRRHPLSGEGISSLRPLMRLQSKLFVFSQNEDTKQIKILPSDNVCRMTIKGRFGWNHATFKGRIEGDDDLEHRINPIPNVTSFEIPAENYTRGVFKIGTRKDGKYYGVCLESKDLKVVKDSNIELTLGMPQRVIPAVRQADGKLYIQQTTASCKNTVINYFYSIQGRREVRGPGPKITVYQGEQGKTVLAQGSMEYG